MTVLIQTIDLSKRYGNIQALDKVKLKISEGDIHGLFGANGAGKSTCIRVLTGITEPDSGDIDLVGVNVIDDPVSAREHCSTIVEIPKVHGSQTAYELLMFYGQLEGDPVEDVKDRVYEAARLTGLGELLNKKFGKMSMGQQHRTEVARAIVANKPIMMMDEPFVGIDVESKKNLKDHFKKWVKAEKGRCIIFTSHNLLENEGFVNKMSFIAQGKIIDTGTVSSFKRKYLKSMYIIEVDNVTDAIVELQKLKNVKVVGLENETIKLNLKSDKDMKAVTKALAIKDIGIIKVDKQGTMEDVFAKLAGGQK